MDESEEALNVDKTLQSFYMSPIIEESTESDIDSMFVESEPYVKSKIRMYRDGLYSPGSGEICAQYVTMSASSVLRHPYYDYPSIKNPGIEKALLAPEILKKYGDDGQELYLDLCKEMKLIPVRIFHRGLVTDTIDLRYYGINPKGMRAMHLALERNRNVKRLDLTGNYLDDFDAAYHLGLILGDRNAIKELVLNKCYIGSKFIRRALHHLNNSNLDLLDLSENKIRDEGFPILTEQIMRGAVVRKLNVRRNELTSVSLSLLSEVIEFHDHTTHLDVSWNKFYQKQGVVQLFRVLRHSKVLQELNISHSSLALGIEIGILFRIVTLKMLDLSNNRLSTPAAEIIAKNLALASSLHTLDLSYNPFTPLDALVVLNSLMNEMVQLKELYMDFIEVNKAFALRLEEIRALNYRQDIVVTHGIVLGNYTLSISDIKVITVKQLVKVTTKKTKQGEIIGTDFLVGILDLHKAGRTQIEVPQMLVLLNRAGARGQEDLVIGLSKCFPGPKGESKLRPINVEMLVEYIHRLYPEKVPTPTPPPTIVIPEKQKKPKKGKK